MTKKEALRAVEAIIFKSENKEDLTLQEMYFLDQISYRVQEKFIAEIRARQEKIPGLDRGELGYLGTWGGELTPGCKKCLEHYFHAIRSVTSCNLRCPFCYYANKHDQQSPLNDDHFTIATNMVLTSRDIKLMLNKAMRGGGKLRSIAWVWYEPFTRFEKHPEIVRYIHDQGIYQHLYTNGTLCTRENLKELAEAGLEEIRFNLAATMCADRIINAMATAREFFPYVCVESPMFKEYFTHFVKKRDQILASGVDHIHCAELHLNQHNAANFAHEDWYQYKNGYVSPMSSRRFTYDLMDIAVEENWKNVVIHDCSNEVKFYRGVSREQFGKIAYYEEMGMPFVWFKLALMKYV
ncbi:MAG: radical SAM protein [bacterium]|nr:radical SAM protein [bacterium]